MASGEVGKEVAAFSERDGQRGREFGLTVRRDERD